MMQKASIRAVGLALATMAAGLPALAATGDPGLLAAAAASAPTNLPEARARLAPPAGFDPLAASDAALDRYGFPPRPDRGSAPEAYAAWKEAVGAAWRRVQPELEISPLRHRPATRLGAGGMTRNDQRSTNWSAYVLGNGSKSYGSGSFAEVTASWTVPTARQAARNCDGTWDYSAAWVGIDGYRSNDVLQAGTGADALCVGGHTQGRYYAWYEWYPRSSVLIRNLPVGNGDRVFVEVWSSSATQGHAYLVNKSTHQDVSLDLSPPSGTRLVGESAEWVVERPEVGSRLATLANYGRILFTGAAARDAGQHSYRPGRPGQASVFVLDMVDNAGGVISYPTLTGPASIRFQNTGSSQ